MPAPMKSESEGGDAKRRTISQQGPKVPAPPPGLKPPETAKRVRSDPPPPPPKARHPVTKESETDMPGATPGGSRPAGSSTDRSYSDSQPAQTQPPPPPSRPCPVNMESDNETSEAESYSSAGSSFAPCTPRLVSSHLRELRRTVEKQKAKVALNAQEKQERKER